MEPENSKPRLHVPATCPYPEPDQSSPCPNIPLPERSILILSPLPGLSSGLFPSGFPTKTLYTPLLSPHTRYMSRSSNSRFHHPHNIGWAVQIIKLLIMQFSPLPCTSSLLSPNIVFSTLFSNTLSLRSSLIVSDQISHPYKTTSQIIVLYTLIVKFFG